MDPEQESKYIKQLLDLDKKIQHISGNLNTSKRDPHLIGLFNLKEDNEHAPFYVFFSEETNRIKNICVPENLKGNQSIGIF